MKREHKRIQQDLRDISSSFKLFRHVISSTRKKPSPPEPVLDATPLRPVPTISVVDPLGLVSDHGNSGYDNDDDDTDGSSVDGITFFRDIVNQQCREEQIRSDEKGKVMEFMLFPPRRPRSSSWQLLGSAKLGERVGHLLDRRGSCKNSLI